MPFQHAPSAVSGEGLLAGKLGRLCHKPAGRELGGWQAFQHVAVDIWCREGVGGEEGRRQPDFSELAASFLTLTTLPAPEFKVVRQPILCLKL